MSIIIIIVAIPILIAACIFVFVMLASSIISHRTYGYYLHLCRVARPC